MVHRRKLLSQFRGWGRRRGRALQAWIHAVAATLTLPFHLIFGITGTFFGLSSVMLAPMVLLVFNGDMEVAKPALGFVERPHAEATDERVDALPPLDPFLADARSRRPGLDVTFFDVQKPFDRGALLNVRLRNEAGDNAQVSYELHGDDLEPVFQTPEEPAPTEVIRFAFLLHFADLGSYFWTALFFLGGIFLSWLTFAGARMYVVRKRKHAPRTAAVVERFFDGFALGLLPAIGVFAWANRLLPTSVPDRGEVEIYLFHGAWVLIGLVIVAFGTSATRRRVLALSGAGLLMLVPLLDGALHGVWPWSPVSWAAPSVGITNLLLLGGGLACFAVAHRRGELPLPWPRPTAASESGGSESLPVAPPAE